MVCTLDRNNRVECTWYRKGRVKCVRCTYHHTSIRRSTKKMGRFRYPNYSCYASLKLTIRKSYNWRSRNILIEELMHISEVICEYTWCSWRWATSCPLGFHAIVGFCSSEILLAIEDFFLLFTWYSHLFFSTRLSSSALKSA